MTKKIKSYFYNSPLKRKIMLIIISVNIFTILFSSFLGLNFILKANNQKLYESIASSLSYSGSDIEDNLENIQTLSNIIISNDVIQQQLSILKATNSTLERQNAYRVLYATIQNYFLEYKKYHIQYISLYNDYFETHTYIPLNKTPSSLLVHTICQKALEKEGAPVWIPDYTLDYGLFLTREVRKIQNLDLRHLGILTVSVDITELIKDCTDFSERYEESLYLLVNDENVIYRSHTLSTEDASLVQKLLTTDYDVIKIGGERYFAVRGTLPNFDWDYICLVSYDDTHRSIVLSYLVFIAILLAGFLISVVLFNLFIKLITRHFDTLIYKMQVFDGEKAELIDTGYDYQSRQDELGVLHRQFDHMASRIQQLIKVNYVTQILMKNAQIKALETQINPHFLYNILESINWRAKAIGENKISQMVESLGKLLRITLSEKTDNFSLQEEIETVKHYMTLQQIRFEDLLHFDLKIQDNLSNASIPKLTIQPLVENAIHYSLEENTDDCYITIDIILEETNLVVYVTNSGSQFEPNLLEKLRHKEIVPNGLGLGLLNIHNRLKLTYGDAYGLSLYNKPNTAVAKITIPYVEVK